MKRIFSIGLLLCLFSFRTIGAEFVLPEYEKLTFRNGLTVYLLEQHEVPLINVTLTVKSGAVADPKAGLAVITAENLLLGTQKLNREEFEQSLDFVGAQIGTSTNLERTRLSASFASKDIDTILPLISDSVLMPAFSKEEFDKFKQRYLSELERLRERPNAVIKSYFDAMLYKGHPYANQIRGNIESVSSIELEDLKAFHSRWYTPKNTALVIAGDIDVKAIKQKAKKLFDEWKGDNYAVEIPSILPKPQINEVLLVNKSDATETQVIIGGPGISREHPDYTAIYVVNTLLGGRFSSWLNTELRINSGLTYGARSRFDSKALGGSFYMSTSTKTETTEEAIDLMLKTYTQLLEKGVDKATLDSAKAYVKGQYPPEFETSGQLSRLLSDMFIYGYDEKRINTFSKRVDQLDIVKSQEIIKNYFPKDKLQFAVVGKAEAIQKALEKYGRVKTVEITDSVIH